MITSLHYSLLSPHTLPYPDISPAQKVQRCSCIHPLSLSLKLLCPHCDPLCSLTFFPLFSRQRPVSPPSHSPSLSPDGVSLSPSFPSYVSPDAPCCVLCAPSLLSLHLHLLQHPSSQRACTA